MFRSHCTRAEVEEVEAFPNGAISLRTLVG